MPLPTWLISDWQHWQSLQAQARLPHALLIGGQQGTGKTLLAKKIVAALLCQHLTNTGACGVCKSCLLQQSDNHPDYKIIAPQDVGKVIPVDAVRGVQPWLTTTAQQGGNKVVLLTPANDLNIHAANAILKHLEEPVSNTFFVLIHQWPQPVLDTIRSRCQSISITKPDTKQALQWLAEHHDIDLDNPDDMAQAMVALRMTQGSPLLALQCLADDTVTWRRQVLSDLTGILRNQKNPSQVAEKWIKEPVLPVLEWWLQWVHDLVKFMQTGSSETVIHQDIVKLLTAIAKRADAHAVFGFYDELLEHTHSVHKRRNTNQQLMLEKLLNDWYQLV